MNVCLRKAKVHNNILGTHITLIYAYLYHKNTVFIKLLSLNVYIKNHCTAYKNFLSTKYTATSRHTLAHINIVRNGMGKMCVKLQMNY